MSAGVGQVISGVALFTVRVAFAELARYDVPPIVAAVNEAFTGYGLALAASDEGL